ncbi:Prosolanapyrone-II oxidase-like protein [Cladobotryum mycophilum]|uniref:Prosolanapyrone-II oxidase-like protein n=1 Tax=Cladobotryum mycophilum TaxID=491253 RepID=A0ABR0S8M2_9HYPO
MKLLNLLLPLLQSACVHLWAEVGVSAKPLIQFGNEDPAIKVHQACRMLRAAFPERNHTQDAVSESNNCWQNASCIVSPSTSEDIAKLIGIITLTQSPFSVRGGGHNFSVNHSSVDASGVLIDMVSFKAIFLSPDKSTVTVGAGAVWGDVYKALQGKGVSVNGARSPNPGIIGQTLGGGFGWFNSIAGVTAASVVGAEIVLANTSVTRVGQSHRDLLWALRGGGPNYGIVTSFTYRTLPIDKMWFEARLFTAEKNQQLLDALVEYHKVASQDPKATITFSLSEDKSAPKSFIGLTYMDPIEPPDVFAPFYDIPSDKIMIKSTIGTLSDLSLSYNSPQYPDPGIPPSRHVGYTHIPFSFSEILKSRTMNLQCLIMIVYGTNQPSCYTA